MGWYQPRVHGDSSLESQVELTGKMKFLGVVSLLSGVYGFGDSDTDYTVKVHAGKRDCYFEEIKKTSPFEFEFQVIDGGDLDITFQMIDPRGKIIATDVRKEDSVHTIDGAYQFCFDNSFSRMTDKVIFFEIFTDEAFDYDDYDDGWREELKKDDTGLLEDRVSEIQLAMSRMKLNMAKTSQIQNLLRAFEAKDRNIIEANRDRVDRWSIIHLAVMFSTAFLQIYLLRHMFNAPNTRSGKMGSRT